MTTVLFSKIAKRRNSTAQADLTGATQMSCALKAPTSVIRPTFLISYSGFFDFNCAFWEGRFYLVNEPVSVADGRWEVTLFVDVAATYKTQILSTSQFVAFAADTSLFNPYIPDARIPETKDFIINRVEVSTQAFFTFPTYILTVNGASGIEQFAVDLDTVKALCLNMSTWLGVKIEDFSTLGAGGVPFDFTTVEGCLEALVKASTRTGLYGNAYADAPKNILNCYMTYINPTIAATTSQIYLGQYATGVYAKKVTIPTVKRNDDITIPWTLGGWERNVHSTLTLYLPYVGNIELPNEILANYEKIRVTSATSTLDGSVAYKVLGKGEGDDEYIIGTYTGNASANVAIGVSQSPSLGNVVQTAFSGVEKTFSSLISASVAPSSIIASAAGASLSAVQTAYNINDAAATFANTTIGTFSGAVGGELGIKYLLTLLERPLTQAQSDFALTMGYPVQRYLPSLTGLSGFVQCANAHIEIDGTIEEIDALDNMLNSGIYLE